MKEEYKVAILFEDMAKAGVLRSVFSLTSNRTPRYTREDDIQNFGYLSLDVCLVDVSSLGSMKLFFKILKFHNRVKAVFLLPAGGDQNLLKTRLDTLMDEEKYKNLLEIFREKINQTPILTHPYSWHKVVNTLDKLFENEISQGQLVGEEADFIRLDAKTIPHEHAARALSDGTLSSDSGGEDFVRNEKDKSTGSLNGPSADAHLVNNGGNLRGGGADEFRKKQEDSKTHGYKDNSRDSGLNNTSKSNLAGSLEIKALVVDDSAAARDFVCRKLRAENIVVDMAIDSQEAIILLSQKRYDVIFLDIMMPGMDGYELCRNIKNDNSLGMMPMVVMMSSKTGMLDRLKGTMAGCDMYLPKPVGEKDLFSVVEKIRQIKVG